MKTINLFELSNILDNDTWQKIVICLSTTNNTVDFYKQRTLQEFYNKIGFNHVFFPLLRDEIWGKKLNKKLDKLFLSIIQKITAPTAGHFMQPIINDFSAYIKSARTTPLTQHKKQNQHDIWAVGLPYIDADNTLNILQEIAESMVVYEQGCGCFIINGSNYIIYNLLSDIAQKNWVGVFNSFAFCDNPEKSLKALDNGTNHYNNPTYTPENIFITPLITKDVLEHVFVQKVLS